MFLSSTPAGSAGAQKLTALSPSQHSSPFVFSGAGEPLARMLLAKIRLRFPSHSNPSAFSAALISSARNTGGSDEMGS